LPAVRHELELGYVEIGLALSIPDLVALLVEPPLGLLADRGHRRRIIVAGGLAFAGALIGLSAASSFAGLVLALALFYPASGAFVSLSQAALMDAAPAERERNMLRWTVAGSVGVLAGPLLIAAGLPWRLVIATFALVTLPLVVLARRRPELDTEARHEPVREVLEAARQSDVVRWLVLLELEDLAGDLLAGFLALYFVDVAGTDPRLAALSVAVWAAADLAGNVVLVRVLERLDGLRVLRITAAAVALLLPTFLLVPGTGPKLAVLACLAAARSCWHPLSQARLYAALPGRSGAVTALSTLVSPIGLALPVLFGLLSSAVGIGNALWVVLLAPLALLVASSRCASPSSSSTSTAPSSTRAG
jgi:FSR family fosmidomycin resistance protein-like MFS transporter